MGTNSRSTLFGHRGRRLLAVASAAALIALTGCSSPGTGGGQPGGDDDQIVIGVAMKTQQQRRWAFDLEAMQKEAEAQGAEVIVQWANDDADAQASQVENLLSQGIDALIIVPVDDKAAASSVSAAKNEGVPVVAYDIGVQGVPLDYMVIRDNPQVGVLQAEEALKFAPEGNYAVVGGDAANDVAQAIHTGVTETLDGQDPTVVYDEFTKNWDPQTALSEAENILSANDDEIAAFVTANDGMATGVIQALKGRNLAGEVYVSGLDADPANLKLIDEGSQTMSVWTQIDEQGKIAADVAIKLAKGEEVKADTEVDNGSGAPIPARVAPVVAITKDNLCEFVTDIAPEGWVTADEIFADPATSCPAG
jgi:D-xylose transport system substrate-binding protein